VYFTFFCFQNKVKNKNKMAEYIDSAVQTVLSSSRLKLAHPGNAKLTQVYPTPSETTSVLAQAVNHRGQFRAASNSKNFPGRSDFTVSSSALLSEYNIVGTLTLTNGPSVGMAPATIASAKPNEVGWIFNMVESIEITYSNSLMQAMIITGPALRDYSLLCCCSKQERIDMMKGAGQFFVDYFDPGAGRSNTYPFSLPLSFLNFAPGSLRNSWPTDNSVLAGPIQISINWRPIQYSFVKLNGPVGPIDGFTYLTASQMPVAFETLNLVAKTTQLQDAAFSVKKAMMLDPQLVYSLPARYITTVDYSQNLNSGEKATINLNSAPSGMLEGIIVTIIPTVLANPGLNGSTFVVAGSTPIDQIALEFGGQYIFRADSYEEYLHWQRSQYGDTLEHVNVFYTASFAASSFFSNSQPVIFIPLVDDGAAVLRGHTNENLPSYGGSQLQLTITPTTIPRIGNSATAWNSPENKGGGGPLAFTNYRIYVTYLISALVEISQGTVDLQL
jgi:hypothetical protein